MSDSESPFPLPKPGSPYHWPCFLADRGLKVLVSLIPGVPYARSRQLDLADALDQVGLEVAEVGEVLDEAERLSLGEWSIISLSEQAGRAVIARQAQELPDLYFFAVVEATVLATDARLEAMSKILLGRWERYAKQSNQEKRQESVRVLVVDEASDRSSRVKNWLQRRKCSVSVATSAGEAIALGVGTGFQVALIDGSLRGLGVRETVLKLRRQAFEKREVAPYALVYGPEFLGIGERDRDEVWDERIAKDLDEETLDEVLDDVRDLMQLCQSPVRRDGVGRHFSGVDSLGAQLEGLEVLAFVEWLKDTELLGRLSTMLLNESNSLFRQLEERVAREEVDLFGLERLVHSFKGGCDAVRAVRLGTVCGWMLDSIRRDSVQGVFDLLPLLKRERGRFARVAWARGLVESKL